VGRVAQQLECVDERIEGGLIGRDRVDDDHPAAGPQHPRRLTQRPDHVRPVVGAVTTDDTVEAAVGEGERADVRPDRLVALQAAVLGERQRRLEHAR